MSALPRTAPRRAPRPPVRPNLRVVPLPTSAGRYIVLALLLVALGVFGVVSLHALATERAFASRNLASEVAELDLRAQELRAEVARLEAPQHVAQVATEQLGMVPATAPGYLVAQEGGVLAGQPLAFSTEGDQG
jgi:cell division protein FtsL